MSVAKPMIQNVFTGAMPALGWSRINKNFSFKDVMLIFNVLLQVEGIRSLVEMLTKEKVTCDICILLYFLKFCCCAFPPIGYFSYNDRRVFQRDRFQNTDNLKKKKIYFCKSLYLSSFYCSLQLFKCSVTTSFASAYLMAMSAGNLAGRIGWSAISDKIG